MPSHHGIAVYTFRDFAWAGYSGFPSPFYLGNHYDSDCSASLGLVNGSEQEDFTTDELDIENYTAIVESETYVPAEAILTFRVQGSEFRVLSSGFRVQGSGF